MRLRAFVLAVLATCVAAPALAAITFVQGTGSFADNATTVAHSTAMSVTAGNLVVIKAFRYAGNDSVNFVTGDLAKTGGTSTLTGLQLDAAANSDYQGDSLYLGVGIWSAIVSGSGSLTMTATLDSDNWAGLIIEEWSASGGWDATRLEDTSTGSSAANNTSATSGDATSAGEALFAGVLSTTNDGGTITITADAAFTLVLEQEVDETAAVGSAIYRVTATGLTDAAQWTLGNNLGWAAAVAVYEPLAGGGGSVVPVIIQQLGQANDDEYDHGLVANAR